MLVVRNIFQAKYGMGDALVELLKSDPEIWSAGHDFRILTDASGSFFTVVAEFTFDSLAAFEEAQEKEFALPQFGEWFARMVPLVESGSREFWTVQLD
jgi:hypothetical protein